MGCVLNDDRFSRTQKIDFRLLTNYTCNSILVLCFNRMRIEKGKLYVLTIVYIASFPTQCHFLICCSLFTSLIQSYLLRWIKRSTDVLRICKSLHRTWRHRSMTLATSGNIVNHFQVFRKLKRKKCLHQPVTAQAKQMVGHQMQPGNGLFYWVINGFLVTRAGLK